MVKPSLLASLVPVENEWDILTDLFESGLEKFYLRKPGMRLKDYEYCLKNIPERFMDRVVLHEHFTIMYDYPFKEIHLKTRERKGFAGKDRFLSLIDDAHHEGLICSTSVHSFEELQEIDGILDRLWVSPVFESISRPGHTSEIDWIKTLNNKSFHSKIVALGGIHEENAAALMRKPFDEIALLGAIWSKPETAVENYKRVLSICQESVHMY
ncbi:MAG TPA: thiamine phosphate synthase [Bacteroidetes bacterium]|nr:thiamine phosphate synthase [Bacteroidota bacterium]